MKLYIWDDVFSGLHDGHLAVVAPDLEAARVLALAEISRYRSAQAWGPKSEVELIERDAKVVREDDPEPIDLPCAVAFPATD